MPGFRQLSRRTFFFLCALFLLFAAVIVRSAFHQYLRSEGFNHKISAAVSHLLRAEGAFMPLHFVAGNFFSDGFAAHGNSQAFFSELRADQIRAAFNWRGLLHRRWQIDELAIQQLDVRFADERGPQPRAQPGESHSIGRSDGWKVDLRKAQFEKSSWRWGSNQTGAGSVTGSAFTLTPGDDSWFIDASSGRVTQTGWPDLSIESARLRYTSASLFVTESVLRTGTGRITVSGEVNFRQAADLQAQLADLPLEPLLPLDWRARLSGKLSGTAKIHAPLSNGPIHVEGNVHLTDGQVEALPLLNQIATFTRTERFRRMSLSKGSLSFTRDGRFTSAKDIVIESEGLLRVEGACTVVDDQIDGVFQIGVTAASLQWLPGSQARVFTIAHDGYFWTPLRLTGSTAHPTEDLTPRLVAAAAGELLQNSQDAVLDTAKSILDLVPH
jgi:hypothetical protein